MIVDKVEAWYGGGEVRRFSIELTAGPGEHVKCAVPDGVRDALESWLGTRGATESVSVDEREGTPVYDALVGEWAEVQRQARLEKTRASWRKLGSTFRDLGEMFGAAQEGLKEGMSE